MSWWNECPAGSIGRVIHFVYHYCGYNNAENCIISETTVSLSGKVFANIVGWEDKVYGGITVNVPVFTFIDPYYEIKQTHYLNRAISELTEFKNAAGENWMQLAVAAMNEAAQNINNDYYKTLGNIVPPEESVTPEESIAPDPEVPPENP
jgi:hypothetical protein